MAGRILLFRAVESGVEILRQSEIEIAIDLMEESGVQKGREPDEGSRLPITLHRMDERKLC